MMSVSGGDSADTRYASTGPSLRGSVTLVGLFLACLMAAVILHQVGYRDTVTPEGSCDEGMGDSDLYHTHSWLALFGCQKNK